MLKIGLTGGIGCGKSTVANLFASKGIPVLDADHIARELVEPGQPSLVDLVHEFGEMVLEDGRLNRTRLRELVFQSPESKLRLEAILHPRIFDTLSLRIANLHAPYCILVIPLLLETGQQAFVDRILVVDCPVEQQYERVKKRDHLDKNTISAIIRSQINRTDRLTAADDLIENDVPIDQLRKQVDRLHHSYLAMAKHAEGTY